MKANFIKREGNTVFFEFELEGKDFKKAVEHVYLENRSEFAIPGFRKGKVPRKVLEMNFGKELFYEDAINHLLQDKYPEAIDELEIEPVAQPTIDIEDEIVMGENITVSVEVDVIPEVKLGDYEEIEVEKIDFKVTDEMVNLELERAQNQNARLVDAGDKEAEEGNVVNLDFVGYDDGVPFEGGASENYDLTIGKGEFIPGFEEQIVGHKKGDEFEIDVTFPEDYGAEELAGKEVTFDIKINNVRVKELPELDDDFAIDISDFDTIEEYKQDIRTNLELQMADQEEETLKNKVIEHLVENSEMDIPRGMIDTQIDEELGQMDFNLRQQGLELGSYLDMMGQNIVALREQIEPMAKERIKANLVLEAVAEAEKIEVTDEEVEEELRRLGKEQGAEDLDEFVEQMKLTGLDRFKAGISNSKVLDLLIDRVKFVEVEEKEEDEKEE